MSERFRVFWDAKLESPLDEFEDAFCPDPSAGGPGGGRRFAVADGATASFYSREWAMQLVRAYVDGAVHRGKLQAVLPELQRSWRSVHEGTSLSWFAAEKLAMGAFAALLGVSIIGDGAERRLSGLAVGDCCLIVVGANEVRSSWPITRSDDFGLNPALLSSVSDPASQPPILVTPHRLRSLAPGDTLFLMSDAIAGWFLRESEAGGHPWTTLLGFEGGDNDGFRQWARGVRQARLMRDDDVTVGIVALE